jgi:lauroyl/myristoyl acyltransferase
LSVVVWLVGRLPYGWLRHLARGVGSIVFAFDRRGREVALANLDSAFGDTRTSAEKRRIAAGSYQTFARTMLELFWSPNLNESVVGRIARFEGLELDSCHKDPRQSAVYLPSLLEL